jgi:hypothetical protein
MQPPFIDFIHTGSVGDLSLAKGRSEVVEKLGQPESWLGKPPCFGPVVSHPAEAMTWFFYGDAVGVEFDQWDSITRVSVFPDRIRGGGPFDEWPISPQATMSDFRNYLVQRHIPFYEEPDPDAFILSHQRCVAQFGAYRHGKLVPAKDQGMTMISTVARDADLPPYVTSTRQREWSLLRAFVGALFDQDRRRECRNPDEVLTAYLQQGAPGNSRAVSSALLHYARRFENDDELERKLSSELGCRYQPSLEGRSAKNWMESVASRLQGQNVQ